jgi:hypothetical protein
MVIIIVTDITARHGVVEPAVRGMISEHRKGGFGQFDRLGIGKVLSRVACVEGGLIGMQDQLGGMRSRACRITARDHLEAGNQP